MGGTLSALKLHLAEMTKNATPESASLTTCNKAMELLDESMREMRRIAHHLMPESLGREGLKTAISEFCKSIPNTSFAWYGSEERLDAKLELNVYRITYELINNAMKHAGASHIFVQIVCDANRISIAVKDDGRGFNTHEIAEGMGFSNIRSHVDSYNGFIDINSAKGEGTEINVELKIMN
jgi:signal transduction histidine kinase